MHFEDIINNLDFLFKGFLNTIILSLVSIAGSIIIGVFLGLLRHSKLPVLSWLAILYIEFIRSTPLILFIFFVKFCLLPIILHIEQASIFISAAVALILFASAYIAEIVRGGLKTIDEGLIEASKCLGLSYFQMMIFVILPIAISRMTPALVSQLIALIKDTSIASLIGFFELTNSANIVAERTFHDFEILCFIALVYFAVCYSLSLLSKKLEGISRTGVNKDSLDFS